MVLSEEEQVFFGEYLRGGGMLFIDAGQGPGDRRFLKTMIYLLQRLVGVEGRLFSMPANHAVYHAYYSYENGFPGELKRPVPEIADSNWYYPDQMPCTSQLPRGLYGVEWQGQVVAIISDLELHRRWSGLASSCFEPEEASADGGEEEEVMIEAETPVKMPALQAASNIVFYALTRPGGVAIKRRAPVWEQERAENDQLTIDPEAESEWMAEDEYLLSDLEASLTFLRAPLDKWIGAGGLRLKVASMGQIEIIDERMHGVLLRNLPAGPCWVEVEYGGEEQGMEIELRGGQVTTVAFSLRGLGFWTSLSLVPQ